jgi:hypothetical protein
VSFGLGANDIDPSLFPHVGWITVAFKSKPEEVTHVPLQLLGVAVPSAHVFPPSVDRSYDCPVTVAWEMYSIPGMVDAVARPPPPQTAILCRAPVVKVASVFNLVGSLEENVQ